MCCLALVFRFGLQGFYSSDGKIPACSLQCRRPCSIPGSGRSPGEGNGNPLQSSCLDNSMDRPWGCKELDMTERLRLTRHFFGLHTAIPK